MQFRVNLTLTGSDTSQVPSLLNPTLNTRIPESQAIATRDITLTELDHPSGDVVMMQLGNMVNGSPSPKMWDDPATETPKANTTEIWRITNMTHDNHPIHIHASQFQILDRDGNAPNANEMGWKDTVQVPVGSVTRVIVPFHAFTGKFVYHCHMLDHEDNEMMRPLTVLP
jgi:spore coat protein A, manganese oxidase